MWFLRISSKGLGEALANLFFYLLYYFDNEVILTNILQGGSLSQSQLKDWITIWQQISKNLVIFKKMSICQQLFENNVIFKRV